MVVHEITCAAPTACVSIFHRFDFPPSKDKRNCQTGRQTEAFVNSAIVRDEFEKRRGP